MSTIKAPDKHVSLEFLLSLRVDNYSGRAKEYSQEETELLIAEKYDRLMNSATEELDKKRKAKPKRPCFNKRRSHAVA